MKRLFILFLLLSPFVSYSQTWEEYSDSLIYLFRNSSDIPHDLLEETERLVEIQGYKLDTVYADYLYRKALFLYRQEDFLLSERNFLESIKIWEEEQKKNNRKLMFLYSWLGKSQRDAGKVDLFIDSYNRSINLNIDNDTIHIALLRSQYNDLSNLYFNFKKYLKLDRCTQEEIDKIEFYSLKELEIVSQMSRVSVYKDIIPNEYIENHKRNIDLYKYDIYRRLVITQENWFPDSLKTADYQSLLIRHTDKNWWKNTDDSFLYDCVARANLIYCNLKMFDEAKDLLDYADSICDHSHEMYAMQILHGYATYYKRTDQYLKWVEIELSQLPIYIERYGADHEIVVRQYIDISEIYDVFLRDNDESIRYYKLGVDYAEKCECIPDTTLADWHLELFHNFDVGRDDNIKSDYHARRYLELRNNNRNDDFYYIKVRSLIEEFKYKEAVDIAMNDNIMKTINNEFLEIQIYINVIDLYQRGHLSFKDCSNLIDKSKNIINSNTTSWSTIFKPTEIQLFSILLEFFEYQLHDRNLLEINELIKKAEILVGNDLDKITFWEENLLLLLYSSDVSFSDKTIELSEAHLKRYDLYDPRRLHIYYSILKDYTNESDALKYLTPAKEIIRRYDLDLTEDAIKFKYIEHEIALRNGDFEESRKILLECFEILDAITISQLRDYKLYLQILFDLSVSTNNYSEQQIYIKIAEKIVDHYDQYIDDKTLVDFYKYKGLNLLYKKPLKIESAEKANSFFEKSLKLMEELDLQSNYFFGEIYYFISMSKIFQGLYYYDLDSVKKANLLYDEFFHYLDKSVEYGNIAAQEWISESDFDWNNSNESFQKKMNIISRKEQDIITRSLFLSDNEKSLLISNNIDDYEWINSFLLTNDISIDYLIELINRRSFIRSFLLENSNKRLFEKVNKTGDRILISQLEELTNKREDLFTALDIGKSNDDIDILNKEIINLEKLIVNYFYSTESKSPNFTAYELIKDNLSESECYVEIIRINRIDETFLLRYTDSIFYTAIVISPDNDPALIMLDDQDNFEDRFLPYYSSFVNDDYSNIDNRSYDFFMKKIIDKVGYDKTIFLSPDGIYNNISIATLFDVDKGKYLLETADIRIVSSARAFISNKTSDPSLYKNNNIEIVGNPKFDLSKSDVTFISDKTYVTRDVDLVDFEKLERSGISQLPGTGIEINALNNLFKNNNWSVSLTEGALANETKIKEVNSPRVMHIATHGFFFPEQEHEYDPIAKLMGVENNTDYKHPLMRSGLLLSGAQNTIRGEVLAEDNGILTSLEARELNLTETELVVLSACETGVGDFVSGEGIYGLQRSILEAGAENVIMSLWKVDDEATQMLMTTFYTNWIERGMTKRESLKQAQITIKNTEGYSSPYYWGAFVLIGK
tara:strand:+ start:1957 stop:6117 length:4161 start_codon:yes stop_codon:yes gene_type:complete